MYSAVTSSSLSESIAITLISSTPDVISLSFIFTVNPTFLSFSFGSLISTETSGAVKSNTKPFDA